MHHFDNQAQPGVVARASAPLSLECGDAATVSFADMGLAPALLQAIADLGYTQPTQVQKRAIALAMPAPMPAATSAPGYCDLMVSSQTGSGKTAAFLLPVLHTLIHAHEAHKAAEQAEFEQRVAQAQAQGLPLPKKPKRKNPLNRRFTPAVPGALVLCPTRELATQVARDAIDLLQHSRGVRVAHVIGGLPYPKQVAQLQNASLVVATPGRLLDLQRSGQIDLNQVQCLVVDEADRMLDLGFAEDLEAIHHLCAQRRQTMMFSATFAPRIQQLGMRVMREGGAHVQRIEVTSAQHKHADITQKLFWADSSEHKRELLDTWLRDTSIEQAIVFASTQIECDALAQDLQESGFSAVALHGAMPQGLRNRRLAALRAGNVHILVATDVAARGIDVPSISHVFNYGLPMKSEDYTHRIGRTGRAGRHGLAISFAEFRDRRRIYEIEQYTRQPFEISSLPGLEPRQHFAPWRPAGQGKRAAPGQRRNAGAPRRFEERRFEERRFEERRPDAHRHEGRRSDTRHFDEKRFDEKRFGEKRFGEKRFDERRPHENRPYHEAAHGEHRPRRAAPAGKTRAADPRSPREARHEYLDAPRKKGYASQPDAHARSGRSSTHQRSGKRVTGKPFKP